MSNNIYFAESPHTPLIKPALSTNARGAPKLHLNLSPPSFHLSEDYSENSPAASPNDIFWSSPPTPSFSSPKSARGPPSSASPLEPPSSPSFRSAVTNLSPIHHKSSELSLRDVSTLEFAGAPLVLCKTPIGAGTFCRVFAESTGVYAVKVARHKAQGDILQHEARVLTFLKPHANIEVFYGTTQVLGGSVGVVLQLYPQTMQNYINHVHKVNADSVDEFRFTFDIHVGRQLWQQWYAGLVSGLRHMHQQGIVHCDIKTDNVFLTGDLQPILGDFSSAHRLSELANFASLSESPSLAVAAFSPIYSAPELLDRSCTFPTFATDTFSLGLVLLQAGTGSEPYSASKNVAQRLVWASQGTPLRFISYEESLMIKDIRPQLEALLTKRVPLD